MGYAKRKGFFAHAQMHIQIQLPDSTGPDQIAQMRRLIWAFNVRIPRDNVLAWRGLYEESQYTDDRVSFFNITFVSKGKLYIFF